MSTTTYEPRQPTAPSAGLSRRVVQNLSAVNSELWLILSLLALAAFLNFAVEGQRVVLGFYTLPTVFSAYVYGRRHAVLTALASALVVTLVTYLNPSLFANYRLRLPIEDKWFDLTVWAGILLITAYAMGSLYDRCQAHIHELRDTYHGVLMILQHFISKDKYTQNHSYRVSVYAARIAQSLGFSDNQVENVRAAALLHDIGKLDVSRSLLYKAARLTEEEYEKMQQHVQIGMSLLQPVGGSLRRVLPIILSHHDKYDGSGYFPTKGANIPLEARVLSVADVYDSLTSDRPYRKAMAPPDAKEIIVKGSGTDFDPKVVDAFVKEFNRGHMEVPEIMV